MYRVNSIYRTFQGEGWWAGVPCTLIRFQGCNLRCPFCDTIDAWDRTAGVEVDLQHILDEISSVHKIGQVLLLTGGEPTLQPLVPLVSVLRMYGPVHLETNGTQTIPGDLPVSWITVSPKKQAKVSSVTLGKCDEIKWLVGDASDIEELKSFLDEGRRLIPLFDYKCVCLQPISQDPEATRLAYEACLHFGWRLSLQLHKYIGVR